MSITLFALAVAGLLPVLLSVVYYQAERKTHFASLPRGAKQILIGISFGILAVLATEFGIPVDGAVLNVRDASPLVAGLIFGWPAGLIAGVIGGVERWFSVLWGGGEFTRLACSLATVLAGVLGAAVRKFMMDNKKASWFYGLVVGITAEVLHMLLVFLTNTGDLQRAFDIVQRCAIPMITTTGLSVMLSIIAVSLLARKKEQQHREAQKIAQTFQRWLLVCVLLAFCVTGAFTHYFQTSIASTTTDNTLRLNLEDVRNDIRDASNENLLSLTRSMAEELPERVTDTTLTSLAVKYDVSEINIVDKNGIITYSTNPKFQDYDMSGGEQSAAFLVLLTGQEEYVQDYQPMAYDPTISRKYAGVALERGGFLQVGYDARRFQREISEQVVNAAKNRHIGQNGCIIICNEMGRIVSDRDGHEGESIDLLGYTDHTDFREGVRFTAEIYGVSSYCMYAETEGYFLIAVLPVDEALFSRDVAVYLLAFMETLVFAALFALIYFLIKKLVVENIQKINRSLARITDGDLDVTVDVRSNEEFASLSDDINTTVVTLKHYIDEAEARIDKELEMAKSIQHSALPSVFPPYPNRREFSIYASMDTAKEVGGDFYDFYLLGENRLAFLMADVSGKGIPAAMFMMTSKTLIKGFAESGIEVNDVFTRANAKLCENNEAGMFVTAWMGVLNLETGLLEYVNAGHNPPVLRRSDGTFEYVRTKPNFILAGMEGVRYRKQQLQLAPGDTLYLYTDGVTEAQDQEQQLFGEERLLESLNAGVTLSVEELCAKVKADVDAFVGEADQFDDITMLAVRLNPLENGAMMTVEPTMDSVAQVSDFLDEQLEKLEVPMKLAMKLRIAMDEIYSNIVRYSGATSAQIHCTAEDGVLRMSFRDNGKPYNPLDAKEPDITAPAEDRAIGGLGILMVRKMMDNVEYLYKDSQNVLTLTLALDG